MRSKWPLHTCRNFLLIYTYTECPIFFYSWFFPPQVKCAATAVADGQREQKDGCWHQRPCRFGSRRPADGPEQPQKDPRPGSESPADVPTGKTSVRQKTLAGAESSHGHKVYPPAEHPQRGQETRPRDGFIHDGDHHHHHHKLNNGRLGLSAVQQHAAVGPGSAPRQGQQRALFVRAAAAAATQVPQRVADRAKGCGRLRHRCAPQLRAAQLHGGQNRTVADRPPAGAAAAADAADGPAAAAPGASWDQHQLLHQDGAVHAEPGNFARHRRSGQRPARRGGRRLRREWWRRVPGAGGNRLFVITESGTILLLRKIGNH